MDTEYIELRLKSIFKLEFHYFFFLHQLVITTQGKSVPSVKYNLVNERQCNFI